MKTKIELDQNFEYPDGKRNLILEMAMIILSGAGVALLLLYSISKF